MRPPLVLPADLLSLQFSGLLPHLLQPLLQLLLSLLDLPLPLIEQFAAARQQFGSCPIRFQLGCLLFEQEIAAFEFCFPTRKFLLLFTQPQAGRSQFIVVRRAARVESGFPVR